MASVPHLAKEWHSENSTPPPPTKRGLTPSEALGSNYCSIVKGTANLLGHGSA